MAKRVPIFEGWQRSEDWKTLKKTIPMLFVPDWSSLGATDAVIVGKGLIDGLFNWAAWPNVDQGMGEMDTCVDASYIEQLSNSNPKLSCMMPVAPW